MDETKVELYAQLGEISVMLGKLTDEKKLKNVSKKVNNLHSLLKRKKNKTMKKRKKNKNVTFSDMSYDSFIDNKDEPMDVDPVDSYKDPMDNEPMDNDPLDKGKEPMIDKYDESMDTNYSGSEPSYTSESSYSSRLSDDVEIPESVEKLSDHTNIMNGGFSNTLTDRYA